MARFKARALGLVTVGALAIGIASLSFWQEKLLTVQAAQANPAYVVEKSAIESSDTLRAIAAAEVRLKASTVSQDVALQSSQGFQQKVAVLKTELKAELAQATPEPTEEAAEEDHMMAAHAAQAAPAAPSTVTYEVQKGDSLSTIARAFKISVEALAAANGLSVRSGLQRGQSLVIPQPQAAKPASAAAPAADAWVESTATPTEAWVESTAEPTEEMMEESTAEATEEAAAEEMAEEATPEPTEEATEEASAESEEEATAEPTEEMMEEPAAEATEEMAEEEATEAEAEATPTEEMMEESAEATEEAATEAEAEATATPTEEMMEEPAAETTEEAATEESATEEEATEEATAEPTEEEAEATEEPVAEETGEPAEEGTEEPTEETAPAAADILNTLNELGNFGTLLSLLDSSGLSETLTSEGPFTLFAPTDAAFAALPEGTVDGLLASSPDELSQILLYHLVQGAVLSSDLNDGTTIVTAQGAPINVSVTADGIKVNDANLTITDIETSNGVIHVIDAVLLPSEETAAVPIGPAASSSPEAASVDAASVIIVPIPVDDSTAAARLWEEPDGKIAVFSPVATGGYHSPVEIIGLSRTFEGNVAMTLVDADGKLLAQRMTLGGSEEYAFFQTSLRFYVENTTDATLNLLEIDMADGSILSTLDTPLTLLPGQRVIDVTSPVVGEAVCDPIIISGYSNTFEANVVLTLLDPNGQELAQIPTIGGSMGSYRDFATPLTYQVNEATPLLVSVNETDAEGLLNAIDQTVIPVTLHPPFGAACH